MTAWKPPFAILCVWLAHFTLGYAAILLFPGAGFVPVFVAALGIAGLAAIAWLWRRSRRSTVEHAAAILSSTGVLFQSIVGLF